MGFDAAFGLFPCVGLLEGRIALMYGLFDSALVLSQLFVET